jgi:tetratricopeptide (TPR) repeat protein
VVAAAPGAVFALPSVAECASANAVAVVPVVSKEQTAAIDRMRSRIANGRAQLTSGLGERGYAELRAVASEATTLGVESFIAEAELALGSALYDGGFVLDARKALARARDHAERAHSTIGIAEALVRTIGALDAAGALDEGLEVATQAETALAAAGNPDRLQLLMHRLRGHLHMLRGELDLAATDVAAATTLTTGLFGADSIEAAESERMAASLAVFQRDYDGARTHFLHAIETVTKRYGDRHPSSAQMHMQLCGLDAREAPAIARPHCDAARAYYEAAGASERAHLARTRWMGAWLEPTGDQQLAALEVARTTLRETAGPDSLEASMVTAEMAEILFDQRKFGLAADAISEQIATIERARGPSAPQLAERYGALGRSYQLADLPARARDAFEHELALCDKAPGTAPETLMLALIELGNIQTTLGDPAAKATFDRAIALASQGGADPTGKNLGTTLTMVAGQLAAQGNKIAALDYYTRAMGVKDLPTRIYATATRATTLVQVGKRREAERDIATARRFARKLPETRLVVEASACNVQLSLEQWKSAVRTCTALAKTEAPGSAMHTYLMSSVAEARLGLGDAKGALAVLEPIAAMDPATLGLPQSFRGELMFVVARARHAAGDEPGSMTAAAEAEEKLTALGLEGKTGLANLLAWRDKKAAPRTAKRTTKKKAARQKPPTRR